MPGVLAPSHTSRPSAASSSKWTPATSQGAGARGFRALPSMFLGSTPGVLVYLLMAASLLMNSLWLSGRLRISGQLSSKNPGDLRPEAPSCGAVNVDALHRHLNDVVLVINIRKEPVANKAVVSMLRGIFGRIFDNIVFLGPKEDTPLGIEVRSNLPWAKNGSYSYFFFPKLVARYPKAAGYLWMDEDVQLNYWQLLSANKSKLWLPESPSCCVCDCAKVIPFEESQVSDCADFLYVRTSAKLALERLERSFQEAYNRSLPGEIYGFPRRRAMLFYVPSRLGISLAFDLLPIFRDVGVVQEAAIPMMFRSLETSENYDSVLNSLVCWEGKAAASPEVEWQSSTAGLYPWSISSIESRNQLIEALRKHDTCIQKPVDMKQ